MNNISQKLEIVLQNKIIMYGFVALGILIKIFLLPRIAENGDYESFLQKWIYFIETHGYFNALKYDFSNYAPAYQYILVIIAKLGINSLYGIKMVSIIFEYLIAFFIGSLLYEKTGKSYLKLAAFAIFPLLPTVLINSSYWAQCDSVYTCFIIGSLFFFFKDKKWLCFLFLGIAISFKFQTIIILPFYFILLLRKQVQWYHFLIVPAVYILSILPAWIAGRPFEELLTVYWVQANKYTNLTLNFPNIYVWINDDFSLFSNVHYSFIKNTGLVFTTLVCLVSAVILKNKKYDFSFEVMIKLAFLCAVLVPFILPGMHERYMFLGDILAVIYALLFMRKLYIPVGILMISTISYFLCTRFHYYISMHLLSIFYLIILICLARDFWKTIKSLNHDL